MRSPSFYEARLNCSAVAALNNTRKPANLLGKNRETRFPRATRALGAATKFKGLDFRRYLRV